MMDNDEEPFGLICGDSLKITKHFNTLRNGDSIGIGRKTGERFIAVIEGE